MIYRDKKNGKYVVFLDIIESIRNPEKLIKTFKYIDSEHVYYIDIEEISERFEYCEVSKDGSIKICNE